MEQVEIRMAEPKDCAKILDIYRYYVENTAVSFEYEVPTETEFCFRIETTLKKYPYLVAVSDGTIRGYAYAGPFIRRAAYDWSAETTIYLEPGRKRQGIGRKLYGELEMRLQEKGILDLYACIGSPENEDAYLTNDSEKFHARMGFRKVGTFYRCGYKFGRWYHMIWMEKIIGEHRLNQGRPFQPFPS